MFHRPACRALSLLFAAVCGLGDAVAAFPDPMDRLVAQACDRRIVLLGEDSGHGAGATVAVKAGLVERLVGECGFAAVLFESQVYDFIALQTALAAGSASRAGLLDAIGGLWSGAPAVQALAGSLLQAAARGRLRLFGLDPQTGGASQRYTQFDLPGRLAGHLSGRRSGQCAVEMARLTRWQYDSDTPWGPDAVARLRACAGEIAAAAARTDPARSGDEAVMADNFVRAVALLDAADPVPLRGRAMYVNLRRALDALGTEAKVVVWTATVHAARSLSAAPHDRERLGALVAAGFGDRAMAIGFSARDGRHGRTSDGVELEPAPAGSVEAHAFAGAGAAAAALVYLDREQLATIGAVPGRAVDYTRFERRDWSAVLDGLVVLREERPLAPAPAAD